jgi:glycerol-3-phosphate O-acyltransferase
MTQIFPHILPDISSWPVAVQSRERTEFIQRLNAFVFAHLKQQYQGHLADLISKAIQLENQRIKSTPWKVDPADEKAYWRKIAAELDNASEREDREEAEEAILSKIIHRYNEEIVGHFSPRTFVFSRMFLTSFFSRLFNQYFGSGYWRWGGKKVLQQNIKLRGNVSLVRSLFEKGTVVILPTHHSNLDSIMVGYAIDGNAGLPSFSYGAGLNLYNVEIVAYFINRLGAFRVDRRKKNPIYLECLKSMTGYSVMEGVNCLFFPGGTRSRSGQTEDKLKLGLISSVIEAQRLLLDQQNDKKIFIVPLAIGYHFVLEASELIEQHLQAAGGGKFKRRRKEGVTWQGVWKFIKDLYSKSSEVYMSFGEPMDVFGNKVDAEGRSLDKFGKEVFATDYFTLDGTLTSNAQRESVYAKLLGDAVVDSYRRNNVILASNVVAFCAFHVLYQNYPGQNLTTLLNSQDSEYTIDYDVLVGAVGAVVSVLTEKASEAAVTLADAPWGEIDRMVVQGMEMLGIYHSRPVLAKKGKNLVTFDARLLFFYHNRLAGYGLEEALGWTKMSDQI